VGRRKDRPTLIHDFRLVLSIRYLAAAAALLPRLCCWCRTSCSSCSSRTRFARSAHRIGDVYRALIGVAAGARGRAQWQIGGGAALAVLGALAIVIKQSFLAAPVRRPRCCCRRLAGDVRSVDRLNRVPPHGALIAAGAILFPLAHQSGVPAALILCDLLLVVVVLVDCGRDVAGGSLMHYLLFYDVVDNYAERRAPLRKDHIAHAKAAVLRGELVLAGALANPVDGTVLLFKGDSPAAAEAISPGADPYVTNGLVTKWHVREWTTVVGKDAEVSPSPWTLTEAPR
jgi:uncharacterized protein YciI